MIKESLQEYAIFTGLNEKLGPALESTFPARKGCNCPIRLNHYKKFSFMFHFIKVIKKDMVKNG